MGPIDRTQQSDLTRSGVHQYTAKTCSQLQHDLYQAEKNMHRCQGVTRKLKDTGRRYWGLVLVVFSKEDGVGRTRDLCSECWTEHKGGVSWTRIFELEQAQGQKRGGIPLKTL